MGYKILWDFKARNDLQQLYVYLSGKNTSAANRTVAEISKKVKLLIDNPYLAATEQFLHDKKKAYRSLVAGNYKIVYMAENKEIVIVRIWDCRRNPKDLRKSLE
ncbi:MAG: type II toxin-antitoxin system RelE/ParE family toxin [Bacteroidales bacterium]|jgi:plasmid stabilization system protein ParE|nr:type II toxin-antitoxin system RelE/ParE family toxin [Bacteroidales bacterium]